MRIAVLSDIHGNLAALQAVEQDFLRRGVDRVVNLGDSLSGPLLAAETAEFLMDRGWLHLAGNHERQMLAGDPAGLGPSDTCALARLGSAHLQWLATLEPVRTLDGAVLLCHGTPRRDDEHLLATVRPEGLVPARSEEVSERLGTWTGPVALCGHTHLARALRTASDTLVLNPGSVGLQAYVDTKPHPYFIENGSPEARYAVLEHGSFGWKAELVQVPYDGEAMAMLARERGFPRWEEALRTGLLPADAKPPFSGARP